jgi:glutamate-1-semialdehyde 2,1-aminomutase
MLREKSTAAFERAKQSLAGGVSSAARLSHQPLFVERGHGAKLLDLDGNEYIDYVLAFGPLVLGHAPKVVTEAIREQLDKGTMFGSGFEQEYLLAEEISRCVPCIDLMRFSNSGSEALHFVLRLARAFTGREKVIKFEGHYHGWLDTIFISVKPTPPMGLPHAPWKMRETPGQPQDAADNLIILPWNDLEAVERALHWHGNDIAAIILEPIMFYHGGILPREGFLEGLRKLADRFGVVLIFDEVVTGFRVALGGAQEFFGVTPDLCVFAKGFAAGLPMAGFGGRRDIMELVASNLVPHMGTYNANPLSVAGALAAIRELARDDQKALKQMSLLGSRLKDGFDQLFQETERPMKTVGVNPIFSVISPVLELNNYRDSLKLEFALMQRFHREMMERGVWFMGRGNFMLSAAHTDDDVDRTLEAAREALLAI